MNDRELMQQALEALEEISGGYSQNLIAALRERLAQPEQEPVAYWHKEFLKHNTTSDQPEQEPIAWSFRNWQYDHIDWGKQRPDDEIHTIPLCTTPPQRKPLTDEEIDALVIDKDGLPNSHLEFARAIEAAHGITGET